MIEIKALNKNYGSKRALAQLNLDIERGRVLGLLGPNGSGKTTLIKILAGLLRPSSGQVLIDDLEPGHRTKALVSYLPDRNFLYKWMKIEDARDFFKDFFGDFDEGKFERLLRLMKLDQDMKVDELSKGMAEKLNLALILSRRAQVYILDEPIAGVDPVARDEIISAIIDNYVDGSTMIITTQLISEMENFFDDVAFLREGSLELKAGADELREERGMTINDLYKDIFA